MQMNELIALASVRSGKRKGVLGAEMGHSDETRLSKIASGRLKADASEIIYLAETAQMPPIEILAEIESERHPELAKIWKRILTKNGAALVKYSAMVSLYQRRKFTDRRKAPRPANDAILQRRA